MQPSRPSVESNFEIDSKYRTAQLGQYTFCRLCLCSSTSLADVFALRHNHGFLLKETIEELLQFKVIQVTGRPWLTCDSCRKKLNDFRLFKITCNESRIVFDNRFPPEVTGTNEEVSAYKKSSSNTPTFILMKVPQQSVLKSNHLQLKPTPLSNAPEPVYDDPDVDGNNPCGSEQHLEMEECLEIETNENLFPLENLEQVEDQPEGSSMEMDQGGDSPDSVQLSKEDAHIGTEKTELAGTNEDISLPKLPLSKPPPFIFMKVTQPPIEKEKVKKHKERKKKSLGKAPKTTCIRFVVDVNSSNDVNALKMNPNPKSLGKAPTPACNKVFVDGNNPKDSRQPLKVEEFLALEKCMTNENVLVQNLEQVEVRPEGSSVEVDQGGESLNSIQPTRENAHTGAETTELTGTKDNSIPKLPWSEPPPFILMKVTQPPLGQGNVKNPKEIPKSLGKAPTPACNKIVVDGNNPKDSRQPLKVEEFLALEKCKTNENVLVQNLEQVEVRPEGSSVEVDQGGESLNSIQPTRENAHTGAETTELAGTNGDTGIPRIPLSKPPPFIFMQVTLPPRPQSKVPQNSKTLPVKQIPVRIAPKQTCSEVVDGNNPSGSEQHLEMEECLEIETNENLFPLENLEQVEDQPEGSSMEMDQGGDSPDSVQLSEEDAHIGTEKTEVMGRWEDGTIVIDFGKSKDPKGGQVNYNNVEAREETEAITPSKKKLSVPNITPLESLVPESDSATATPSDEKGTVDAPSMGSGAIIVNPVHNPSSVGEVPTSSSLVEPVTLCWGTPIGKIQHIMSSGCDLSQALTPDICNNIVQQMTAAVCLNNKKVKFYECIMCSEQFLTQEILQMHKLAHASEEKPFKCLICPKAFKDRVTQVRHRQRHYNVPQRFECEVCNRVFLRPLNLKNHIKNHTGRVIRCKVCGEGFSSRYKRANHMAIHNGQIFPCPHCNRAFDLRSKLTYHLTFHSQKSLLCEICGKNFRTPQHLRTHKQLHDEVKRYSCKQCSANFSQYAALWQHRKWHEGNKKYVCNICNKGFVLNCQLRQHQKIHTNASIRKGGKVKAWMLNRVDGNAKATSAKELDENQERHPKASIINGEKGKVIPLDGADGNTKATSTEEHDEQEGTL